MLSTVRADKSGRGLVCVTDTDSDAQSDGGAVASLLDLWHTAFVTVAGIRGVDWDRPVADGVPGSDVTGLVTHLTGVHYAGPDRLVEGIDAARARAALRLHALPPSERVLGAQCLDMCLHGHDLARALDRPFDLASYEPAALQACRLLVGMAPRLLLAALGPDSAVRLLVRPDQDRAPVVDRTVRLRDGRPSAGPADARADTVDVTAAGLLLLLTGRRDADGLAAAGQAGWSGDAADRFVHRARLVGASA